jgi:hypothetical protein
VTGQTDGARQAAGGASDATGQAEAGARDAAGSVGVSGSGGAAGAPGPIVLNGPIGLAFDAIGRLLVADSPASFDPGKIIAIDLAAGTGTVISKDALYPGQMVSDRSNVFLTVGAVGNGITEMVIATGSLTRVAGSPTGAPGFMDATGAAALFDNPLGMALDGKGSLYVAEHDNDTIRKVVLATGEVTTAAGAAKQPGDVDETGGAARFRGPSDVAYDVATGTLYVVDDDNLAVRRVDVATGKVTTLAGGGAGTVKTETGETAGFAAPGGLAADGQGTLYVGDAATIRKIDLGKGVITTLAGTTLAYVARDGIGAQGTLVAVGAMVLDGKGDLYFTDCATVRRVDLATRAVTTLYGDPTNTGLVVVGCVTAGQPLLPAP